MGERTDATAKLNQSRMIFDLVNQLTARMQINGDVGGFVVKLLDLALKAKANFTRADSKYMTNTLDFVSLRVSKQQNPGVVDSSETANMIRDAISKLQQV